MNTLYSYTLFPNDTTATVSGESLANKYGIIENKTGYIFAICSSEKDAIKFIGKIK